MIRVFILKDKKTCVNVHDDNKAQDLINDGAYEITDLSIFKGYEHTVSPLNTTVNPDGVSVTFNFSEKKFLEDIKQAKLSELSAQALAFEDNVNKSMYFISSVFVEKEVQKDDETTETIKEHLVINGDRRTRSNLQDLIAYQPTDNVIYRDYNNQERTLTKEQLQVILKEHVVNGEAIYHQKWEYEAKIKACTTIEELNAIEIKFTMHDFSKEEVVADE